MARLLQLLACLVIVGLYCSCAHSKTTDYIRVDVGDVQPCTPNYKIVSTCGDQLPISENVTTLTAEDGFDGPNVCKTETVYQTQTYSYTWQLYCHKFHSYCSISCLPEYECNGPMVNITKTEVDCCDGFAVDQTLSTSSKRGKHGRHSSHRNSFKTNGCPIMLRDSVLDCLVDLGLTSFLAELGNAPELLATLSFTSEDDDAASFTLFAPSNEAFNALSDLDRMSSQELLGGHIVNRTIFSSRLRGGYILTPFDEQFYLHVTTVSSDSIREIYLNGANITQRDACQARNGIVHGLGSVIPLSDQTITEVLTSQSDRLSSFSELLNKSEVAEYLSENRKSRTLFAPTNDALDKLPSGAVECLLREENRKSLEQFVLIHVASPTEYNSTLSQRSHVSTLAPVSVTKSRSRYHYRLIVTAANGSVSVTKDQITIEEFDIPASNGVIHVLPEAIVPVDFDKLCPVIPTEAPSMPEEVATTTEAPEESGDSLIDPVNVLNTDTDM